MSEQSVESAAVTGEAVRLPLWKGCLEKMVASGLKYGKSWPVAFFEAELRMSKNDDQFKYEVLNLRAAMERDHGYYLKQAENGQAYEIPTAFGHEEISQVRERKISTLLVRTIELRLNTLHNPEANLTKDERAKMEAGVEKAQLRHVLYHRSQSIANVLMKAAPKLLSNRFA